MEHGLETGYGFDEGDPRRRRFSETRVALGILGAGAILQEPVRLENSLCFSIPDRRGSLNGLRQPG